MRISDWSSDVCSADLALRAVIIHHAGRIGVDAHLVLDRPARQRIACPERAVVIDEELGHDEQRNALDAVGRVGSLGKHEMDDIIGEVMLARRDENLRRSEEHTSELKSLKRSAYAVFCLKKKKKKTQPKYRCGVEQ